MPDWLSDLVEDAHLSLLVKANPVPGNFLRRRGVSLEDVKLHKIGYVGSYQVKKCAENFIPWQQEFLHQCLVFPLYSPLNEVIGIQIRSLNDTQFTRSYKQYYAYRRDLFPYFFGLPQALPGIFASESVVLVEGIFDYFAVRKVTPNVLAILTSGVPVACRRFLTRYTKLVIAMLDMDEPGREGCERLANEGRTPFIVNIPTYSEKDPGELLMKGKLSEISRIVSNNPFLLGNTPGISGYGV